MATTTKYKVTRESKADEKFAPQAQAIIDAIKTYTEPVSRETVLAKLEKSGALNTRQSLSRVFSFFRPKLIQSGIVREYREPVAKAAQPAKSSVKKSAPAKRSHKKKSETKTDSVA